MSVKKLGLILIPLLVLYVAYDKLLAKKEILPNLQRLEAERALKEEELLMRQYNSKKLNLLVKQLKPYFSDFRLHKANPASHVQNQIRFASNSRLQVNSGSNSRLKPLYKESTEDVVLYYLDTAVTARDLNPEDIADLLKSIDKAKPKLSWQSLSINSNNPESISLNGTLRSVYFSEGFSSYLKGGKK